MKNFALCFKMERKIRLIYPNYTKITEQNLEKTFTIHFG